MIQSGERYFRIPLEEYHNNMNHGRVKNGLKPIRGINVGKHAPLKAEVNHGRWICRCPFCNGAEFVFLNDPLFLCTSCLNDGTGEYIRIKIPKSNKAIENILNKRKIENRNWTDEKLSGLTVENLEQGVK